MKKRGRLRKGLAMLLSLAMVVGMMPDLSIMKVSAEVAYNENGFAEDGSYEPATPTTDKYDIDGDGANDNVYEISNAGQLYWFAGLVNGTLTDGIQDTSAKAVLTQDITVNTGVLDGTGKLAGDTKSFTSWTPIGNYINNKHVQYTGTFDGKGHTISGLYFDGSSYYLGFFGCVGSGGSVSNVGILDSYFSGGTFVGGVCGDNFGTITNCYHTGVVRGYDSVGGVCGYNSSSGSIKNCYHTGAVRGTNAGGVCGDNNSVGSITNCYYEKMDGIKGGIKGSDVTGKAQGKDTNQFSGGEVAYLLSSGTDGSIWGQTLTEEGRQYYPVLGGEAVYCICNNGIASYDNHDGESEHLYDNGICSGCGIYEVPKYENDCYQIANKGNLYWFAGLVNGDAKICTGDIKQDTSAKAVLTQDITVNTGVLDGNGELAEDTSSFTGWTPIGNYINITYVKYTGTFDGKGHTISGLYFDGSISCLGFFGCVGSGGSVSNVGIVDSYFSGGTSVGGVCGENFGTITNCYHTGSVSGYNAGGVCGYNESYSTITNCYHTGAVRGTNAGGVCGDKGSTGSITNCYYETMDGIKGGIKGSDETGKAQGKTTEQFSIGEVAYLLSSGTDGSIWGQTLIEEGRQPYPVLGGAAVYKICKNGGASYANNEGDSEHSYNNGICSGCGIYEMPKYENDCYQIANKGNLYWFAGLVNGDAKICTGDIKQDTSAKAVLTKDITVNTGVLDGTGKLAGDTSSFTSWTPIGNIINNTHVQYTGTFDGKGHTISGLYFDGSTSRLGFFGYVEKGGSVSNVGILDSYFSGGDFVGGVCGDNYGTITNCYHTGSVSGTNAGGVCGYNNSYGSITNCYHTGSVRGTYAGGVCGYKSSSGSITNCYYETMDGIKGGIQGSDVTGKAQGKDTNQFGGGEVAYLLSSGTDGSIWGQTLTEEGQQAYPVLGGKAVYRICKDGSASYANNEGESEHSYNNGICSGCGIYEVPVYKNDCYQIANKGNLYWFAGLVNGDAKICTGVVTQNKSAKAVLAQDITVNTGVLDENGELAGDTSSFTGWTPIGNDSNQYTGTFDGKGYKIEGLYFKDTSTDYVGLFGYIGKGGCICNVGIEDSYFHGRNKVGGVCGNSTRGTITNCYNTGSVKGTFYLGGVCGMSAYETITNCYHTGVVSGTNCVGGVCGDDSGSTITNCYHTGLVSGTKDAVGGVCGNANSSRITNCYYETMDGIKGGIEGADVTGKAEGKTTEQFNDGEVAYLLSQGCTYNGTYYDGSAWGQTLTGDGQQAYPVFGVSKVYLKGTYTGCECNPGEPTSANGYSNEKNDTVYGAHSMTAHSANNATCTKDGNLAYWTCSNGEDLYYKDEAGTEKYNSYDDDIKLPATGHADEGLDGKCDVCGEAFKTFKQLGKLIDKVNQNLSDGKYADVQYTTASIDNLRRALVAAGAITAQSLDTEVVTAFDNLLTASTVDAGGLIKADKNIVIQYGEADETRGVVAGSGWYAKGDTVTLKVMPRIGYRLSKWTTDAPGNTSVGTENLFTFVLAAESPDTYYVWLDEVKYTVTCESAEGGTCTTDAEDGKYVYGQIATVTATADENYAFVGWKDSYKTTVSTDYVYSFTVLGDTTLTPEFVKTTTEQGEAISYVTVSFYHQSGKLLDSQKVVSGEEIITTTVNAPTKVGFDFLGWTTKKNATKSEEVIDLSATTFSKDTCLYPVFAVQDIKYTLKVDGQLKEVAPQSGVMVIAEAIEGKQFVGWKNEAGNIVSYDSTYTFIITGNTTLTSYYEPINAVIEKTPTINMSAPIYEDIDDNGDKYYKMIFYFDYTLPEDCTLIDIGTIKVKNTDLSSEGITLDTENVSQYSVLSKLGVDGQFYYSKANYYGTGHTVAGYMIYEKNGIRYTVYSNAMYGIKTSN